jgi:hypothetical protein
MGSGSVVGTGGTGSAGTKTTRPDTTGSSEQNNDGDRAPERQAEGAAGQASQGEREVAKGGDAASGKSGSQASEQGRAGARERETAEKSRLSDTERRSDFDRDGTLSKEEQKYVDLRSQMEQQKTLTYGSGLELRNQAKTLKAQLLQQKLKSGEFDRMEEQIQKRIDFIKDGIERTSGPYRVRKDGSLFTDKQDPLQQILDYGRAFGLTPSSTTGGQHAPGSFHYQGRAADFGDAANSVEDLRRAHQFLLDHPEGIQEAFYDVNPAYIDNEQVTQGTFGGHGDHLHLAI